jgi:hypothetical protein
VRLGDAWDNEAAADAFADGFREVTGIRPDVVALREKSRTQAADPRLTKTAAEYGRVTGDAMKRRGELSRHVRVLLRTVRDVGAAIVGAIQKASADARDDRDRMVARIAEVLAAALQEGATRAVVVDPGTGRSVTFAANDAAAEPGREPAPTTPPGGPANDDEPPPESGPPPATTPRRR